MLPCFSALRFGRCRGRVRVAVLPSAPLNGVMSKLFPSLVETATGLAGSTLSNSSTGLSRISANEFPCRTSILIISGDSLYIHCITAQALILARARSSDAAYPYFSDLVSRAGRRSYFRERRAPAIEPDRASFHCRADRFRSLSARG